MYLARSFNEFLLGLVARNPEVNISDNLQAECESMMKEVQSGIDAERLRDFLIKIESQSDCLYVKKLLCPSTVSSATNMRINY